MGYESRLYVVNKHDWGIGKSLGENKVWGEVIATFNLCVVPDVAAAMKAYPATNAYFYLDGGGGERVLEDNYGEPLAEIPIADAVGILEKAAANEDYRRFAPCIQMLKGFSPEQWDDLVVLHYGY